MKTFVLSVIIVILASAVHAQTKEPVSIYDPIVERNFDYPAAPIIKYNTTFKLFKNIPQSQGNNAINYENPEIIIRQNDHLPSYKKEFNPSTILVINNKIYSIGDWEFQKLNPSQILEMNIVKDDASTSSIKAIIFIKTK